MPNLTSEEKENRIDQVEQLIIMGYTKPSQIVAQGVVQNIESAKEYIAIAQRRLRNRYDNVDRQKMIKREIKSLDLMERKTWADHSKSKDDPRTRSRLMQTIVIIQKRRAELLGLDVPKSNVNLNLNHPGEATSAVSPDDIEHVITSFKRITDEIVEEPSTGDRSAKEVGAVPPPSVRADIPATLPDQPGSEIPPEHNDTGTLGSETPSGSSPA